MSPHAEFILTGPKKMEFRPYEDGPLAPRDVRVLTHLSGIKTGTEMAIYRGTTPFLHQDLDWPHRLFVDRPAGSLYPCYLGSWGVGEVIAIGSEVTRFKVGDLVHGGMLHRPTFTKPEHEWFPMGPGLKPEQTVFIDPALFALVAIHDAQVKVGDRVAVFGMGALGLITIQIARLSGAETVIAVDLVEKRLELAKQFGADILIDGSRVDAGAEIKRHIPDGVDVAIEFSGSYVALQNAIRAVHQDALVVAASFYQGGGTALQLGAEWHHNRVSMISSMPVWGNPHRCAPMWDLERVTRTAMRLVETGKIITEPMISHEFAYADAPAAYSLLDQRPGEVVKVLLNYNGKNR